MKGKLVGALLVSAAARQSKGFVTARSPFLALAANSHVLNRPLSSITTRNRRDRDFPMGRTVLPTMNDIFHWFDDFDLLPSNTPSVAKGWDRLHMDIKETKDAYEILVDVPGVDESNIDINLHGDHLTVAAHKEAHKKEDGTNYHRVERFSGHLQRTIILPENADREQITAENDNGVLKVVIKKTANQQPEGKKIEVKGKQPKQAENIEVNKT